jgi:Tfp pilus assembly protein PilN
VSQLRQQVNLYQETAPPWRPFGSATLALAVAAVSGCLAVIWGYGTWQVDHLQRAVGALQHQQQAQQAMLSALGSLPGGDGGATDLQSRIQELNAELAAGQHALAVLQGATVGSTSGFSAQLTALARHPMEGLWLQQITVSDVTGSMSLQGEVTDPDKVPRYLHALGTERTLAGMRFDRLAIQRPQPKTAVFRFHADGMAGAPGAATPVQLANTQVPRP